MLNIVMGISILLALIISVLYIMTTIEWFKTKDYKNTYYGIGISICMICFLYILIFNALTLI